MPGWVGNVERETLENGTFRTGLFTGDDVQLTVVCVRPGV